MNTDKVREKGKIKKKINKIKQKLRKTKKQSISCRARNVLGWQQDGEKSRGCDKTIVCKFSIVLAFNCFFYIFFNVKMFVVMDVLISMTMKIYPLKDEVFN